MENTEKDLIARIIHESDRIRQFELETSSTPQTYTNVFRNKIITRALRCGGDKLAMFVKVLEAMGYGDLAIVAGQEATMRGRYRHEAHTNRIANQPAVVLSYKG